MAAPSAQEMLTAALKPLLKTHPCAVESALAQPPAFRNQLRELIKFILKEACQVNPTALVCHNDIGISRLFPWLISSNKMTQFAERITARYVQPKAHRCGIGNFSLDENLPKLKVPESRAF